LHRFSGLDKTQLNVVLPAPQIKLVKSAEGLCFYLLATTPSMNQFNSKSKNLLITNYNTKIGSQKPGFFFEKRVVQLPPM